MSPAQKKVEQLKPPPARHVPTQDKFILSRWTIRIKLMLIISGIIFLALTGMNLLATYFFKNDNKLRIEVNNHKLAEVISINVSSIITSMTQHSRLIGKILHQYPRNSAQLGRIVFKDEKNLIFVGMYTRRGDRILPVRDLVNTDFLVSRQIMNHEIQTLINLYRNKFIRSFSGKTVLINASPGFKVPIVGLSFPSDKSRRNVLIAFFKMNLFLDAFQTSGITETFMVDEEGSVVAHPDSRVVLSGKRLTDLPIVSIMKKSPVDNGQTRYRDSSGRYFLGSFKKLPSMGVGIIATVPEDKAFAAVNDIQRRNFYLMIVVVTAAILFVFFYARKLYLPILNLATAANWVKDGNYDVWLEPETRDELGLLTTSFNSMTRGLQERDNLKVSFGKFVNKELAELSLSGDLDLGGESKICTICFSDIREFTPLSEKLSAEKVVSFLNDYFKLMVRCVNETHGIVDKFIGDAIMSVWGALKSYGNDSENAVNACLMMRKVLIDFNKKRSRKIQIGCGINTGQVVAGQIGSDEKLEYTVIGDEVNLASRVESLNKIFHTDILITNNTYKQVNDIFKCIKMDEIKVKGKTKPVTVYAVLGRNDDEKCPSSLNELRQIIGIRLPSKRSRKK